MLEREKNLRGKREFVLMLAIILSMGMCITVFARTITGETMGLNYTFVGSHNGVLLEGSTKANIYDNGYSYVMVKFQKDLQDVYSSTTMGIYGDYAYLRAQIGNSKTGWRVFNRAFNKMSPTSSSVSPGAYSLY